MSDVARHFYTHFQTCLATNQVVEGCENVLQKVESNSTFCNKMFTCCTFYPHKANLFCNKWRKSRVIPAYFYPIRSEYSRNLQQPDLLQDRFERGWQNTQYRFSSSFVVVFCYLTYGSVNCELRDSTYQELWIKSTYQWSNTLAQDSSQNRKQHYISETIMWGT